MASTQRGARGAYVDSSTELDIKNTYLVKAKDPHLPAALSASLPMDSWQMVSGEDSDAFLITDDLNCRGPRVVMVVDDAPGTCQYALMALYRGEIGAVVSRFELDRLPLLLEAAMVEMVSVPVRVVQASVKLPRLEQRQREVLDLLATGLSNTEIANRMHVSQATVKREVSYLLQAFQATNRLELAMRGAEAGLVDTVNAG